MAFDDAIGGSFNPRQAIDDLIRDQDRDPGSITQVSPDFLADRLYRKMKGRQQDQESAPTRPTNVKPKKDAPDFSSQGIPADDLPDFADQGMPADQVPQQQPAPTVSLGVTGQAKAAMKGLARGAIDQAGAISKGLSIASKASPGTSQAVAEAAAGMDPAANWPLPGQTTPRDAMPPPETRPVQQMPGYQTGQAIQDFAERNVPMTPQEQESIGGRVGTGIGAVAPYLAAGAINPALGVAAGGAGFAASTAADTFDAAIKKGASEEDAAKAAGYSALVGGALGTLPLGMVLKPIRIASPVLAGRAAGYLEEAVKGGLTFAGIGEAQEYLLQRIAREFYDPEAGYSPDAKRAIASLITGGLLGAGGHFMERRAARAAAAEPAPDAAPTGPAALGGPPGSAPPPGGGPGPGAAPGGGPSPRPEAERAGIGREKLEKILRYYGYDDAEIAAMSHAEMSAAVLKEMGGAAGPKPKPAEEAPKAQEQPKKEAKNTSGTEQVERDGLKRYGWSEEEIDQMSPAQRRREFQDAMASGQGEKPEDANLRKSASSGADGTQPQAKNTTEQPQSATASSPDKVVPEPSKANSINDLAEGMRGMGAGIGESLRDHLWQRVQAGETSEGRGMGHSPLLQGAKILRERGGLQTREQFDAYAKDQAAIEGKGPAFQQAMRDLLAKHLPKKADEGAGKREAPIVATTAEDVQRAQPVEPASPAQAAAENYQHAHLELPQYGLEGSRSISVETGLGQERKGVDSDGKPWSVKLTQAAYGRIKGTKGADGQPLDIFIGPEPASTHVFVIDQHHPGGGFDEHKIMAGFRDPESALRAYASSYTDHGKDRIGHVVAMGPDEFKQWLASDTTKPLKKGPAPTDASTDAGQVTVRSTEAPAAPADVPKETPTGNAGATAGGSDGTIADGRRRSSTIPGNFPGNTGAAEPLSLLQFIASKGGVAPHAELRALDLAGDHRVQLPGQRGFFGVVRPAGMPLDLMREAAEEAGYLKGEHNKTSTVRDFLDAIDTELRGGRHAAEGEEGHATKRQRGSERERSDAARDKAIVTAREDIAAEYGELPEDLLDKAAEIMADERLDLDSAVEMAAVRMVAEDADYGVSASDLQNTFGEDVSDAIRPRTAPENGEPAGKQGSQGERPSEAEEAGSDEPPVRDLGEAGREEAPARSGSEETAERVAGFTPSQMRSLLSDEQEQIVNMWHQVREPVPANASEHYKSNIRAMRQELAKDGFNRARTEDELRDMLMDQRLSGEMVKATKPEEIDQTEAGEQRVLPGAEKIGQGEQAQRAADKPLKPGKAQKAADEGLFGDSMNQRDLLDVKPDEIPDLDGATAEISAGDSDETVTVTLSRKGPWDFNDTWPAPDVLQVRALDKEGRNPFGDSYDVENVVAMLDEGMHGITSAIAEIRYIDKKIADIQSGKTKLRRNQTPLDAMKGLKSERAVFAAEMRDTAASYEDVFGRPAANAMVAESRRRLRNEESQRDPGAEVARAPVDIIERALGDDADRVAPVDIARAAEIMADQPGIEPEAAFGQAVIKGAVEQGFITEQEAVEAYGEEVRELLEPQREGASGSGAPAEQERAASDEVSAGAATENGELPRGSETGAREVKGAEEAAPADAGAASGRDEAARDEAGNAAENQPAAEDAGGLTSNDKRAERVKDHQWWKSDLTAAAREIVAKAAGLHDYERVAKVNWPHLKDYERNLIAAVRGTDRDPMVIREAPTWTQVLAELPMHANGRSREHEIAFDIITEMTGNQRPKFDDLTPSQKDELLQRVKALNIKAEEPTNGVPSSVHAGDAAASPEAVQPAQPGGEARGVRSGEGEAGERTVQRTDEGRAEGAGRVSEGAVRKPSRGSRDADADRLSEPRADNAADGRAKRDVERAANLVEGENHVIEPGSLDESRGQKAKARDNIHAIYTLKKIEAEDRPATAGEQRALALYAGWGGIKNIFPDAQGHLHPDFLSLGEQLRSMLSPEEYETARRSIQYAHYTAEDVVRGMWDAVARLGFKGGHVFEPGMGTGNFAGMMPADIAAASHYAGIELDHVTAHIAKLLYPKWGVRQDDFTKVRLPENTYDLVIGNPPFADIAIKSDSKYKQDFLLHDYFFAKSLDAVRPGGLLAFVTSAGTMNKIDPGARNYLADQADLVGAVRLPGDAFKKNAGTDVTTDIIFLRKRLPGDVPGDRSWTETKAVSLPGPAGQLIEGNASRYFSEHPEMVLGKPDFADKLYQGRYSVKSVSGSDLKTDLARAIDRLPQDVMADWQDVQAEGVRADFGTTEKKEGTYYVGPDGNLHQVSNGVGMPVKQRGKGVEGGRTGAEIERIKGLVPVRDALREVYAADLAGDAGNAQRARDALNRHYDAFVEKFGPINKAVIQTRRPNVIQMEGERAAAREEARYAGERFREGDFDDRQLIAQGASTSVIARERQAARQAAADARRPFDEGDFDPNEVPDVIIDKRPNVDAFMDDPESYRLRAIERYDEGSGKGHKSPVFFENIITREKAPEIKSTNDALLYSLSKFGRVNIDEMAAMLRKSPSEVVEALDGQIFQVPGAKDTFETRDEYLSGNVRKKLALAKKAAERNPALRRNVDALEAAQPVPLAPSQIHATLGMPWLPPKHIEKFATEALGIEKISVRYLKPLAQWIVSGDTDSVAASTTWGTADRRAPALMQDALNRQNPKIYDDIMIDGRKSSILNVAKTEAAQDKVKAMQEKFSEWIWSDQARSDELAGFYNENFNNLVVREYDGEYMTTPGISASWSWRPHQKRVIARIIQSGNTYVAHAVGAGKTSEYIGAIMEMRRLGLVRKPMVAVPNHMLAQFTKEWYEQYPMAKLSIADDRQFHTDRRKQFIANVAMDDLDAVIITHSAFGMIPVSEKFQNSLIQREISQYRELMGSLTGSDNRITRSRVEKQIERLEQRLIGKGTKRKDAVFTFEEMGIDHLTVDEAHIFRKLDFATQMSSLKGVSPEGSAMAWDLYVKAQYLDEMRPGRSLVLGSGTPITNTMAELYTLQRYLQPQVLAERGIEKFDAWAGAFGESVSELEQDAAGNYKPVSRFAKFVNVAELSAMVRQVMDVVTSKQLEQYVTRPQLTGGKRQMHLAEKSPELEEFQADLASRMTAIQKRKGPPQKGDDIMLSVINDGRHAAIDMRLAGGGKSSEPSKLDMMVDNVFDRWKATRKQPLHRPAEGGGYEKKPAFHGPATQLIFINLGLSGARGFSVPDYIRAELVRRGIPKSEIAYIYDFKSQTAKQRLFNDMNEGKVTVLMGSVAKMGVGTNVQRRLSDIHNMDPLWYPADDEQRNGRGIRQGNMNPEIGIHDYSTKGTYDSTMWGMMAKKAKFIQGFFEGDPSLREMDDLGEASQYEQAKALTTNDPRLIRFTEIKQELERAQRRKTAFDSEVYATRRRRADAKSQIEHYTKRIEDTKADIAQRVDTTGDAFKAKVGKQTFDKRTDFTDALWDRTGELLQSGARNNPVKVGDIGGFPIWAEARKAWTRDGADTMHIWLQMNGDRQREVESSTPRGTLQTMEYTLKRLPDDLTEYQDRLAKAQKFYVESETKANAKFEGQGEINQLARQVRELEADLKGDKPEPSSARGSFGELIAHKLSEKDIARVEELINQLVQRMVGNHVRVRINRDLIGFNDNARSRWGELGKEAQGATGMFYPWRKLIELALTDHIDETAFHESYHAIEYLLQTPDERELMQRETPRLRKYLKKTRPDYTDKQIAELSDEEIRANAFEDYAAERRANKANAGEGVHMMIRAWWDKLLRMIQQLANGLRGMGFKTYHDIFEKAYEGGYAKEPGYTPRADSVPPEGWQEPTMASIFDRRATDAIHDRLKDLMKSTASNRFVERYQNLSHPVMRLQEAVEAKMRGTLPDSQAFYTKKRLFPGKVGVGVEDFNKAHLDPLIAVARDAGLSLPEVGDILYALHAPERNAAMEEINHPALDGSDADVIGRRSGMSDEQAAEILARHDPALVQQIDRIMHGIRDFNLDMQVESGLLSRAQADAYREKYEHYVPLSGWDVAPEDQDQEKFRTGGAFNVRGKETQRAFGRKSKAQNPLVNAIEQSYRTIDRAKKNEYLRSLRSALGALDPDELKGFVRFDQGKPKKTIDPMTGLVIDAEDPFYRNEPGAVGFKIGGNQRHMIFEDRDLGEAIKRMHANGVGMFEPLLKIQNKLKSLWTHYSPDFLFRHFMFRYPIEGTLNSFEQKESGDHSVANYLKNAVPFAGPASRAIFAENKGRTATGEAAEMQQYWREMRQAGGSMNFNMRDIDRMRKHMEDQLSSLHRSSLQTVKDKFHAAEKAMEVVTNALDNSLRLAAFASARRQGKTPEQAALIARDATVDFQLVGKWKNAIGLWFPFGNVVIQTGIRMTSAVARSRIMRRVFMGTMLAGFMAGMFNYLVGGEDENKNFYFDKIPEWDRHLNFIMLNPFHRDEKGRPVPIKIPMPYNWAFPFTMGSAMSTLVFSNGKHKVREMLAMVTKAGIEVATPFGQEANTAAMLAPELARPAVHILTNKNWNGAPVHQDETFQKGPNSYSGRKSTGDGWKYISEAFNTASGGDKHHAGMLDFYPEDLRLLFDYIGGSQRRLVQNFATTATNAAKGESPDYTHMPLARVIMGTDYDQADKARRYQRLKEERQPWKQ